MVSDRYEIHIQTFLLFIDGKLIISQSSSPHFLINLYSTFSKTIFFKKSKQLQQIVDMPFRHFEQIKISDVHISKIIF